MNTIAWHRLAPSLVIAAAALLAGCAEEALLGPDRRPASPAQLATAEKSESGGRAPELGACTNLRAPAGSERTLHVYATGVQIYRWNGTGWSFDGPSAELFADAEGKARVGTHSAGPIWKSVSGDSVAGSVLDRCIADPNAIPWLALRASSDGGPGVFQQTTFIQRVNTTGGKEPSYRGTSVGEVKEEPYTAEYYFYRAP